MTEQELRNEETLDEKIMNAIEYCLARKVWIYPRTKKLLQQIKTAIREHDLAEIEKLLEEVTYAGKTYYTAHIDDIRRILKGG